MKSDALVTLCQNCFKYDETRFDNPFGYLTQIIKYCFITFLEKEEIIRDIKDSLWESIGMTPSYARQIRNEMLKDLPDQSSKAMKVIKKDAEVLSIKIDNLSSITSRLNRLTNPDIDIDWEISEALGMDIQAYTGDIDAALSLFVDSPRYDIDPDTEIAGNRVICLSVYDDSTRSNTKRVIQDTNDETVILALCSIGLAVRRDLLVKKLREISGYNLSNTRIPTAERIVPTTNDVELGDEPRLMQDHIGANTPRRRGRRKNAD
jgi:hypothetical protein